MADLATFFDYDALVHVKIVVPAKGDDGKTCIKETGLTVWVAPFNAPEVERVDQIARVDMMMARANGGGGDITAADIANLEAKAEIERCVAAVKKWDWGGNSFEGVTDPECTVENKRKVFSHRASGWIVKQIVAAGVGASNFLAKI